MLRTAIRHRLAPGQIIVPPLVTMAVSSPTRSSPRTDKATRMFSTASAKRSAPVSPLKGAAEEPKMKVARANGSEASELDIDDLGDEADFDADALIEATLAAEEEEMRSRSSQSSASNKPASSQTSVGAGTTVKDSPSAKASMAEAAVIKPMPADALSALTDPTLTHGDERVEKETMDAEWYDRLKGEMEKPYFRQLKEYLRNEQRAGKTIYPPAHLIHSWSRLTPLSKVKIVVVGQDPYHGPKQACGHSFSVPKGVPVPGSLQNIYKELVNEYGAGFVPPKHGCLDGWAKQGVLLLNACLTVQASQAGSHHNKGWEPFTQTILRTIAQDAAGGAKTSVKSSTIANMFGKAAAKQGAKSSSAAIDGKDRTSIQASPSKGVVFLAWGLPAAKTLAEAGITEKSPNILLLKSPHPSPLSAHRGFLGNGHFKKANEWLESEARYGRGGGINWTDL